MRKTPLHLTWALLILSASILREAEADVVEYVGKIVADESLSLGAGFGRTMAISPSGRFLAVGAPDHVIDYWLSIYGSVQVFSRNQTSWDLIGNLTSPNMIYYERYGSAVAISEDKLVVAAPRDSFEGSYVYTYIWQDDIWVYSSTFVGEFSAYLGASLALDGDLLLVGLSNPSGSLLAFTWTLEGWSQSVLLNGTDTYLWWRNTVAMSSNWILAGSFAENDGRGAAYLWPRYNNFIDSEQPSRLFASGASHWYFGLSAVFVSNHSVVIGGIGYPSMYAFSYATESGWTQTNVISGPFSYFLGSSLSFSGNYLIAGDPHFRRVIIFSYSSFGWSVGYEIPLPPDAYHGGLFGETVFIHQDTIIVSDSSSVESYYPSGAIFFFNTTQAPLPSPSATQSASQTASKSASPSPYISPSLPGNARVYRNIHAKSSNLGFSISIEGNVAAIGQPMCSEHSRDDIPCGKVYMVETTLEGWSLMQYVQYLGRVPHASFGASVLLKNGWLVVTSLAPYDYNTGIEQTAVIGFKFSPNHGKFVRKYSIAPPVDQYYQYFGKSLAMDGNFTIISSPYVHVNDSYGRGRVFIFHYPKSINHTHGAHSLQIVSPNADDFGFGLSIAASNGIVVISTDSWFGGVYVFSYDGLSSATLIQSISKDSYEYSRFGYRLIFEGNNLFVSSYDNSLYYPTLGSVHHFVLDSDNQFQHVHRITAYDEDPLGYFGVSLAYNPKTQQLAVGSSIDWDCTYHCGPKGPGAVYLLENMGANFWSQIKYKLGVPNGRDQFGYGLAINDAGIVVGAPFDRENGENRGAVYFIAI